MTDPTMVVANRGHDTAHVEAEPVLVQRDGEVVRLVLDDGDTLEFDATELRSALGEAA